MKIGDVLPTCKLSEIRFETICWNAFVSRLERQSAGILEPIVEKRVQQKPLRSIKDFCPRANVDCRSRSLLKVAIRSILERGESFVFVSIIIYIKLRRKPHNVIIIKTISESP